MSILNDATVVIFTSEELKVLEQSNNYNTFISEQI